MDMEIGMADASGRYAGLLPNTLLVLSALDALDTHGSPTGTKHVAWSLGKSRGWVRRYGEAVDDRNGEGASLCHLSVNGSCSMLREGRALAALLRTSVPSVPPQSGCYRCGSGRVGGVHHARALYACGAVWQWCPPGVSGGPAYDMPARSRKSQHTGTWFPAAVCGRSGYRSLLPEKEAGTCDGVALTPGMSVWAGHASGMLPAYAEVDGTVLDGANGVALVSWPAVGDNPAVAAAIMPHQTLVSPGGRDGTNLSAYQDEVWEAIRCGTAVLVKDEALDHWKGTMGGRAIGARALEVMVERRILQPVPVKQA